MPEIYETKDPTKPLIILSYEEITSFPLDKMIDMLAVGKLH